MKKLISTIMCLALLVGCLAGCGGNTQTGAADGKGLKNAAVVITGGYLPKCTCGTGTADCGRVWGTAGCI